MKNKKKMKVAGFVFILIKPFIVPIIIIAIICGLVCSLTDMLYIVFNNEDKIDMKEELAYYDTEYEKEEMTDFFSSVWDFVAKIFGGGEIADYTEWPVDGYYTITSYFGYRDAPTAGATSFHGGLDIGAPEGAKLVSIMDAEVLSIGWWGSAGYTIKLKSIDGEYNFSYYHVSPEYIVSKGQKVKKGEIIGKVGPLNVYGVENNPYRDSQGRPTNGATTGCHCHFEVRRNGELIDPLEIVKKEEFI